jgi:hypothetical protein
MPDERNPSKDQTQSARRTARLAGALRANLRRRKAQAKGRSASGEGADHPAAPHDSAGIPTDKLNR